MVCISCKRNLLGDNKFTSFPCPKCGETVIFRCSKCKTLSNEYTCEKCGFIGP
ncbi:RNA-binding protein [Candidatus Micrarchaeota archaeon RBG_16_49_10]|nr:MAG: RNA-binding protein [Candidatus Micrarchaeota archaeon RBG_16_49_10]